MPDYIRYLRNLYSLVRLALLAMNPLPTEFKKRFLEAALDLLWRQWCSLGAAGHAQPAEPTRIIDPEALL